MTDAQMYPINDLYASVQGEGTHTGVPMVIVRLHGCPVGCPFCDTKETWHRDAATLLPPGERWQGTSPQWTQLSGTAIARLARVEGPHLRWILLTGGEPALQPLRALTDALHAQGFKVALETSGTALGFLGAGIDHVCVSPKVGMPGGRVVDRAAVHAAHEIKWLIGKAADLDRLHAFLSEYEVPGATSIALQPISANEKATQLALDAALEHGWRVSIQVHKYLNVR